MTNGTTLRQPTMLFLALTQALLILGTLAVYTEPVFAFCTMGTCNLVSFICDGNCTGECDCGVTARDSNGVALECGCAETGIGQGG